jgi:hypothetical protein
MNEIKTYLTLKYSYHELVDVLTYLSNPTHYCGQLTKDECCTIINEINRDDLFAILLELTWRSYKLTSIENKINRAIRAASH